MILFFTWIVYTREGQGSDFLNVMASVTLNAFFFFAYAYITAYILVPVFLVKRRFIFFSFIFLILGFLLTFVKYHFSDLLFYSTVTTYPTGSTPQLNAAYFVTNTKDMSFIVAVFIIAKYAKDNHYKQRRLHELHDQQASSEIRVLKNQLDPHIIFNNLNNLYSISLTNSEKLPENISKLRALLDYYFHKGQKSLVRVTEELQVIEDYIGLEKLRYTGRLKLDYFTDYNFGGKQIVPFLLFSIVENCFQHGCADDSGNIWIMIKITALNDGLSMIASNSKPANILIDSSASANSRGSITRMLSVFYPGRHALKIDERDDSYTLDMKISL
ncbi:MAG TPA: histidine kinase [Bacteroidales bacterium]|nr:histidine kinase [Bacteroidales bacterium]